jgi:hypothetical protein
VGEARQIGRLVEKFDPDQATAFGQRQLGKAWPMVEGQMGVGLGGIGPHLQSPFVDANGKDEARPERAWAERTRLPRLTALEMPSTPMAK